MPTDPDNLLEQARFQISRFGHVTNPTSLDLVNRITDLEAEVKETNRVHNKAVVDFANKAAEMETENADKSQLLARYLGKNKELEAEIAGLRKEPKYHHPDCNYWKWDRRFSWDTTDCTCEAVAGPTAPPEPNGKGRGE